MFFFVLTSFVNKQSILIDKPRQLFILWVRISILIYCIWSTREAIFFLWVYYCCFLTSAFSPLNYFQISYEYTFKIEDALAFVIDWNTTARSGPPVWSDKVAWSDSFVWSDRAVVVFLVIPVKISETSFEVKQSLTYF